MYFLLFKKQILFRHILNNCNLVNSESTVTPQAISVLVSCRCFFIFYLECTHKKRMPRIIKVPTSHFSDTFFRTGKPFKTRNTVKIFLDKNRIIKRTTRCLCYHVLFQIRISKPSIETAWGFEQVVRDPKRYIHTHPGAMGRVWRYNLVVGLCRL